MEFVLKAIIGGIVIATVSTVSERYPTIGAFILGIPLASFVSFIFMYYAGVAVSLSICSWPSQYEEITQLSDLPVLYLA